MRQKTRAQGPEGDATAPGYRTGAVARMLRMPAATLRIWERRYGVAAPATTSSGHRQYSAADVERLALVRQLTLLGHPIGSLAGLDFQRLREVASTHATALSRAPDKKQRKAAAWNVAVVGMAGRQRIERPAVQRRLARAVHVTAAFESLADVRRDPTASRHDALIVFVDGLQVALLPEMQAAARALGARRMAVVHSFAAAPVARAFDAAGVSLLRSPADDDRLGESLNAFVAARPRRGDATVPAEGWVPFVSISGAAPPPRRYDDAALADFAGLSSTIACECPRHLAEIVMQLSHFEAYSEQCRNLDAADAALHAYLGTVTGTARSLFESALERVARHEGLVVP